MQIHTVFGSNFDANAQGLIKRGPAPRQTRISWTIMDQKPVSPQSNWERSSLEALVYEAGFSGFNPFSQLTVRSRVRIEEQGKYFC